MFTEIAAHIKDVLGSQCAAAIQPIQTLLLNYVKAQDVNQEQHTSRIKDVLSSACPAAIQPITTLLLDYVKAQDVDQGQQDTTQASRIKDVLGSQCAAAIQQIQTLLLDYVKAQDVDQDRQPNEQKKRLLKIFKSRQSTQSTASLVLNLIPDEKFYVCFTVQMQNQLPKSYQGKYKKILSLADVVFAEHFP